MREEDLKGKISKKLKQIEKMIQQEEQREKIDKEKKELDEMLEEYVKHI